jgi:cation-transporting ATPase 13A1
MAVNNSMQALTKVFVYCTEPFRIPYAGRIDVACFDKTGTLTAENLVVEGVVMCDSEMMSQVLDSLHTPLETRLVLASAHALVLLDDGVVGDPMEKNTLESIGWEVGSGDRISCKQEGEKSSLHIQRRFPFSSGLKRMSSVSYLSDGGSGSKRVFVSCKGAPETLKSMFKSLPKEYDEHYKYWARLGKRVLALGYKVMEGGGGGSIRDLSRPDVESELIFAGFLIFYCPLKPDSLESIRALNESAHRTVVVGRF